MINLKDKLTQLEDKYYGDKQKIYFQEIIMNHPQIIMQDFKKGRNGIYVVNKCLFCSQKFRKYFGVLREANKLDIDINTVLCTSCLYLILSVKSQKLKIQYFDPINYSKTTTKPNEINHTQLAVQKNKQSDDWGCGFDEYSLNFDQQDDEMIKLAPQKTCITPQITNKQQTISSKQSTHREQQKEEPNQQKQVFANIILSLLQKIKQNAIAQINPINLFIKILVFQNSQKQEKKSGLHESNYLKYFERSIFRLIVCKTYNEKDRIKKNQVEFIYEYWIKGLKSYLQMNHQIKIREYINRNTELTKKIIMRDSKIADLNKYYSQEFVGFKKNGNKWNEIIRQLRMKLFNYQSLKDLNGRSYF